MIKGSLQKAAFLISPSDIYKATAGAVALLIGFRIIRLIRFWQLQRCHHDADRAW